MPTLYKRHFPIEYLHYLIGIVDFRRLAFSFLSTMLLERPKELTHLGTWESKPPMRESTKVVSEDYLEKRFLSACATEGKSGGDKYQWCLQALHCVWMTDDG